MPALIRPNDRGWDKDKVKDLLRREFNDRVRKKLKAILMLMEGKSQKAVARELDVSSSSVREWRRQWNGGIYLALLPRYRSGAFAFNILREVAHRNGFELKSTSGRYNRLIRLPFNDGASQRNPLVVYTRKDNSARDGARGRMVLHQWLQQHDPHGLDMIRGGISVVERGYDGYPVHSAEAG